MAWGSQVRLPCFYSSFRPLVFSRAAWNKGWNEVQLKRLCEYVHEVLYCFGFLRLHAVHCGNKWELFHWHSGETEALNKTRPERLASQSFPFLYGTKENIQTDARIKTGQIKRREGRGVCLADCSIKKITVIISLCVSSPQQKSIWNVHSEKLEQKQIVQGVFLYGIRSGGLEERDPGSDTFTKIRIFINLCFLVCLNGRRGEEVQFGPPWLCFLFLGHPKQNPDSIPESHLQA